MTDALGHVCTQKADIPHHMAYSITTGDIAVVDSDNVSFGKYMAGNKPEKQHRVIVMDTHPKLKFQCRGIGGIESGDVQQSRFYPEDVCFDRSGDVLIVELVTKSVMLIDGSNGNFLRTVYVSNAGRPLCMCLQDDSALLIAHQDGEINIIKCRKYNLVVVKNM